MRLRYRLITLLLLLNAVAMIAAIANHHKNG
jgi:hypothetical protein